MITPKGAEPEDMDKIGCQVYTLLVITEGYKKRMLDWQDSIRKHFEMPVIVRDMDPEFLLKGERESMLEEIEKMDWTNNRNKPLATRLANSVATTSTRRCPRLYHASVIKTGHSPAHVNEGFLRTCVPNRPYRHGHERCLPSTRNRPW